MAQKKDRRDFLGMAFGGVAAVGGAFSLVAMKRTWDPLPSVQAAGFLTVDVSPIKEGEVKTVQWRGQPIFILRKTKEMGENPSRDIIIDGNRYVIFIALCTHLGCIPSWRPSSLEFVCACHGGGFDSNGVNIYGPPKSPMVIPPFKINGATIVIGEEGPEYQQLRSKA